MSHDDFAFEPVRGLPAQLPPGETLLWQGSPRWQLLAVRAFHVRKVAVYFALLLVWRLAIGSSHGAAALLASLGWLASLGLAAVGLLCGLAFASARASVYSITSARIVLRHGVAVSLTINVPFALIDSANISKQTDGSGEIALTLSRKQRISYLVNWPHVQAGHFLQPRPALRGLADVSVPADILAAALRSGGVAAAAAPSRIARLREPVAA